MHLVERWGGVVRAARWVAGGTIKVDHSAADIRGMRTTARTPRDDRGFTVTQVLVAVILVAVFGGMGVAVAAKYNKKAIAAAPGARQLAPIDTALGVAAQGDVAMVGREIATYYVDSQTPLSPASVGVAGNQYLLNAQRLGRVSTGLVAPQLAYSAAGSDPASGQPIWCVQLTYGAATRATVSYSQAAGPAAGPCRR